MLLQVHWPRWQMSLHCWLGKFCRDWLAASLCRFHQLDCSGKLKIIFIGFCWMTYYQTQTTFNSQWKDLSHQAEFDFLDSAGSHPIFRWRKIINQTVKIFLCIKSVSPFRAFFVPWLSKRFCKFNRYILLARTWDDQWYGLEILAVWLSIFIGNIVGTKCE